VRQIAGYQFRIEVRIYNEQVLFRRLNDFSSLIKVVENSPMPHCGIHWTDSFHPEVRLRARAVGQIG
jgi:hypothetical protein